MAQATPDDIATLIYTSGTTGKPKGAMLSVANVDYAIDVLVTRGGFTGRTPSPDDLVLSYLPLCHVVERAFTVWFNAGGESSAQVNITEDGNVVVTTGHPDIGGSRAAIDSIEFSNTC